MNYILNRREYYTCLQAGMCVCDKNVHVDVSEEATTPIRWGPVLIACQKLCAGTKFKRSIPFNFLNNSGDNTSTS